MLAYETTLQMVSVILLCYVYYVQKHDGIDISPRTCVKCHSKLYQSECDLRVGNKLGYLGSRQTERDTTSYNEPSLICIVLEFNKFPASGAACEKTDNNIRGYL